VKNVRKWFLRTLVGVVALIGLFLLAVQIVLWTALPEKLVVSTVQEKLKLRISAEGFSTGWSGHTTLTGVTAALPLAQDAFLQTKRLAVTHTPLWALLAGRPLEVKSIEIDAPNLLVMQQADGRWNLQEVADLIARAGGGASAETQPTRTAGIPQLPKVFVNDATIRLVDLSGRQATLNPVWVQGYPEGPLVWRYDAKLPDRLHVVGEVAPGGNWAHQLSIRIANLGETARPFLADSAAVELLKTFSVEATWIGHVDAGTGGVVGRLDLKPLKLAAYTATGPMNVAFVDGSAHISPAGVVVAPPGPDLPPIRAGGGSIALDGKSINLQQLVLGIAGGEMRLGGSYAWNTGQGALDAAWNKLVFPKDTLHSGTLTATLHQPWPNQPVINISFTSTGTHAPPSAPPAPPSADRWNASINLAGKGTSWDSIDWHLTAPQLTYSQPKQSFVLDQLDARLATRGNLITLESLSLPPGPLYGKWRRGTLGGRGQYARDSGKWSLYVNGNDWPVSPTAATDADFFLNAYGDRDRARLAGFFIEGGGIQVWADGDLAYRAKGMPADLNVYGAFPPVQYVWHERDSDPQEDVKFSGLLFSELHVAGTALGPTKLNVDGTLRTKNFKVKDHPVGFTNLRVAGDVTDERLHLETRRLRLFSGNWDLYGDYRFDDRMTKLLVSLDNLSLAQLDNFIAGPPKLRGRMSGRWNIHLPEFDVRRLQVEGEYHVTQLARLASSVPPAQPTTGPTTATTAPMAQAGAAAVAASYVVGNPQAIVTTRPESGPPLVTAEGRRITTGPTTAVSNAPEVLMPIADKIDGKVQGENGTIVFDPILLERKDGRARARLAFPIDAPRLMRLDASAAAWPLEINAGLSRTVSNVLLWANAGLDLDLKRLTAKGPVTMQANISAWDQDVCTVFADAVLNQRRVDLKSIGGNMLGGKLSGDGYVYLDQPLLSAGRVSWENINATRLIQLYPVVEGLGGSFSGSVTFAPTPKATHPDATGPFGISGKVHPVGGYWKYVELGDLDFLAYLDDRRVSLDKLNWQVDGGTVNAWARVTRYDQSPFAHVRADFADLSLDPLMHSLQPPDQPHKEMPGKLSGRVVVAGNPRTDQGRREASGDFNVRIAESDLANVSFVNVLYSVMSVKLAKEAPSGHGYLTARLEGQRLEIPSMRYQNRGVDVWMSGTILDVFKGRDAPVEATAAGSARPLKDLKLPFMADVDQVLKALQGGLATVEITGNVGKPVTKVIPFAAAGDTFRRFMLGEVRNEVRGTAGR
jgi:hypothetical protein